MTGVQALVRLLIEQSRRDRANGSRAAALVSGYQGSPLGVVDLELGRNPTLLRDHGIVHQPAVNEELAATALLGSQLVGTAGTARFDRVVGMWYGKTPGLDRAADAIRHANHIGCPPSGGVLAVVGDDAAAKSSTIPGHPRRPLPPSRSRRSTRPTPAKWWSSGSTATPCRGCRGSGWAARLPPAWPTGPRACPSPQRPRTDRSRWTSTGSPTSTHRRRRWREGAPSSSSARCSTPASRSPGATSPRTGSTESRWAGPATAWASSAPARHGSTFARPCPCSVWTTPSSPGMGSASSSSGRSIHSTDRASGN